MHVCFKKTYVVNDKKPGTKIEELAPPMSRYLVLVSLDSTSFISTSAN